MPSASRSDRAGNHLSPSHLHSMHSLSYRSQGVDSALVPAVLSEEELGVLYPCPPIPHPSSPLMHVKSFLAYHRLGLYDEWALPPPGREITWCTNLVLNSHGFVGCDPAATGR